jgi:large subunit ribosomal protein L24
MNIKKGDLVQVIAGKDKGLQGKVIHVIPEADKLVVEGVNRVTRHVKDGQSASSWAGRSKTGGIITQEAPIHVSNVMLVDPETKKPTRIGFRKETVELPDGSTKQRSVRISKRTGKDI